MSLSSGSLCLTRPGPGAGRESGRQIFAQIAPSATDTLGDVELLQADGVEEAARVSASAFLHSPPFAYIFEELDEGGKLAALQWLFEVGLRLMIGNGSPRCVYARSTDGGGRGEMVVSFILQSPGTEDFSMWAMVLNGFLLFPFRFGFQAFSRLLQVKSRHEDINHAFMAERRARGDDTPFCTLERMAVRPSWQGKGAGSRALRSAVEKAGAQGQGVLLSTQERRNVTFYSRLGFAVVGDPEPYYTVAGSPTTNYVMAREPSSCAAV